MYSLVIFTMVMIAVFSDLFGGQVESSTKQEAAGYDVLASASETNPPSPDSIAAVDGVERVSTMLYGTALFLPKSLGEPQPWWISGIDSGFVEGGGYELTERARGLDTDADVYSRLLEDPETVVIDGAFLATGGGPPGAVVGVGDSMAVINPVSGEAVTRKIIGVSTAGTAAFTGTGVLMSQDSVREVLEEHAAPSRFYIETADGSDPNEVAANLQGEFVRNGVEADSFRALVEESANASVQFLRIMEGYLALGLLVGIAGLGVVMVRAVRERRRVIGVLRSLGFLPPAVRQAFLLESGFVAIQGIVIGSVLALVTASQLVAAGEFGEELDFRVPWFSLLVLCGSAFVASLIATAWPAQQASNIPPAVALRIAD
jgi:putative ABC transport system permease protein